MKNELIEKYKEFDKHLLEDEKPSIYFYSQLKTGLFSHTHPFTMLGDLINTKQSPEHHPEGNVWNHTMLVVDEAASRRHLSENPRVFMWAALLHDLGKAPTTKLRNGKYTSYDHDKHGKNMVIRFLNELTDDKKFIDEVSNMVRWHMQILFVVKDLPFADIEGMYSATSLEEIALLSLCDRLGRGKMSEEKIEKEKENVRIFLKKSHDYIMSVHKKD